MKRCIFFCIIVFSVQLLFSQEAEDDVIVVDADKIEQKIDESVEQKKTITGEDIRKSGSKTVGEALKTLPDVAVSGATAGNANESVTMQGLGNGYVKIMIDGVSVSTDISGSTPIFQIPVENIERIEVIKGADSVLYGSDAMGGVINIVTKRGKADSEKEDAQGTEKAKLKIGGGITEEVGFMPLILGWKNYAAGNLTVSGKHISNTLIGSFDFNPGKERMTEDALAGKIKYYENTKKILGFVRDTLTWKDSWGSVGAYGVYSGSHQISNYTKTGLDKGADMTYTAHRGEFGFTGKYICSEKFYADGFLAGKLYFMDTVYNVKAGLHSSSTGTHSNSFDVESDTRAHWKPNKINDITFGANVDLESMSGTSFEKRKYALETAFFAQDSIALFDAKLTFVPGVRFDVSPSVQGSRALFMATPKFGIKYNPTEKTALRLSYGMGYKIPTLKEKYWIFRHSYAPGVGNFILYGNPNLVPEKSHSFNIGVEQNVKNLFKVSAGGYFNYILDLIDSVVTDASSSPQIREYRNVDKAMTYGGDILISSDMDRLHVKVGYAYTGAKFFDKDNGRWENLALRVAHRVTAHVAYRIPVIETTAALNVQWNSPQLLTAKSGYYTPDYFMVGFDVSKKFLDEKLEAYIGVDNMLNNIHFVKGTNGETQKKYYGLADGIGVRIGGKYNFGK
ncbi:TonB-dependent receptor [Treponema socranskii]|uniref:TonB-dependent receptor plug domain-containing protein n=1 Tax=Treponema socranskii TaxID=53419 RepID=UPI0028E8562D|nr:TonB-dependent receptor [Treponema socranskii]